MLGCQRRSLGVYLRRLWPSLGKLGRCGRKQASIAIHVSEERFPAGRGFLTELEPLAAPLNQCRHVRRTLPLPTIGCVDRSGKPLASWWTH